MIKLLDYPCCKYTTRDTPLSSILATFFLLFNTFNTFNTFTGVLTMLNGKSHHLRLTLLSLLTRLQGAVNDVKGVKC